jgi:type IV pilus assembly protein PilN
MIKINLLLARKEKKKVGIKKEIVIFILAIVLLGAGLSVVQWRLAKAKDEKMAQIEVTKKEIAYHKSLTTEVNKAKEAQKILQDKLNVINTLRKEKSSPSRVLDELSIQKPERVHFESVKKDGLRLGIEGIALDDETVANFMTNLRNSKLFRNVDLIVSEQVEQRKLKLKKFTLACEILIKDI